MQSDLAPNSITSIAAGAFSGLTSLQTLYQQSDNVPYICKRLFICSYMSSLSLQSRAPIANCWTTNITFYFQSYSVGDTFGLMYIVACLRIYAMNVRLKWLSLHTDDKHSIFNAFTIMIRDIHLCESCAYAHIRIIRNSFEYLRLPHLFAQDVISWPESG